MSDRIPYVCGGCGAEGVKLWREYQTFLDEQTYLCARCAGERERKDVSGIDPDGRRPSDVIEGDRTDQIGWMVPAVPTPDGSMWGYTSAPQDGVEWWRALPSMPPG